MGGRVWDSLRLQLGRLSQLPDLELGPVLLEHVLAVVLPELLGRVLACHALEDLGAARVLVDEIYGMSTKAQASQEEPGANERRMRANGREGRGSMLLTCNVVHTAVDDYVHAILLVFMLADLLRCERLRHAGY